MSVRPYTPIGARPEGRGQPSSIPDFAVPPPVGAGAVASLEEVLADQRRVLGRVRPDTLDTAKPLADWRQPPGSRRGATPAGWRTARPVRHRQVNGEEQLPPRRAN
ncbi:hypothetical protein ACH4RG_02645 [Streptomyces sp. NPDC021019]|uniref:hypothetical protein n=1 Tax=Streptomyces sp. NPDC021019 TaxID=3365108 RepID=UPI0037B31A0D